MITIGKAELVGKVLESYGKDNVSKAQMNKIVSLVFDEIKGAVNAGNRITIVNFGSFSKVHKEATTRVVPNSDRLVDLPARDVPKFKCSSTWKNDCNE